MKYRVVIFTFSLISLFLIICFLKIGTWLSKNDELYEADAIVILMGSIADRVLQASDLYHDGFADNIIFVESLTTSYDALKKKGVNIVTNTDQVFNALISLGIPEENINVLKGGAKSTMEEASIIRDYIGTVPGVDTLILVSSNEHMRRASMIFEKTLKDAKMML
jgi:uncharacterized SAM-binding protein YcdF (DUF218 family)